MTTKRMYLATAIAILAISLGCWVCIRRNVDPRFVGQWSSPNPSPGVEFLVFDINSYGRGSWSHRIGVESWPVAKFSWVVDDGAIEFRRHRTDAWRWIPTPIVSYFNIPPYFDVMRYDIENVETDTIRLRDTSGQALDLRRIND